MFKIHIDMWPLIEVCLRDYLSYKMITSQNVSSEAQVKNFIISKKSYIGSHDIQVFVFLTIP